MHRDMKVGLSLGVLLVGIVGALFFRREPEKKKDAPPALENAQQFDAQIAERPNGPYITGTEEIHEPSTSKSNRPGNARAKSSANRGGYETPEFLTAEDKAAHENFLSARNSTPDPIAPPAAHSQSKSSAPPPVAPHNRDWETAAKPANPTTKPDATPPGAAGTQTYVIQSGDTLSTIAARFLGSSARYREIYEANRQTLRSPDDLREGMQITIPGGTKSADKPRSSRTTATTTSADSARDVEKSSSPAFSTEGKPGKGLFAPANRGVFNAGRVPRSNAPAMQDKPRNVTPSGVELGNDISDE